MAEQQGQQAAHAEHPSTYVVQDRASDKELQRLQIQDRMMTDSMGGVLPEQPDPTNMRRVLDIGSGTGCWLIEMARTYPSITQLVGVEVNNHMVEFANAQAAESGVADRVQFHTMDALRALDFPDQSFDLVNERFGTSYLRTWDWPKLLQEMARITRANGVVRVTEGDVIAESSSEGLKQIHQLLFQAVSQAGHAFTQQKDGLTSELSNLLIKHGFNNVQTRTHNLEFRAGTPQWQAFYDDMKHGFQTLAPFFRKWTKVPEDYDGLCQRALSEMQQPDFYAIWHILTVWGINPHP